MQLIIVIALRKGLNLARTDNPWSAMAVFNLLICPLKNKDFERNAILTYILIQIIQYVRNFYLDRDSETQFQVGENLNYFT